MISRGGRCGAGRRDALAAWAEYQATGRHVAAGEADGWLARLEAGKNAKPPSRALKALAGKIVVAE